MEQITIHSTFVIERTYRAAPERVFRAFANPEKKRSWFVDGQGHEVEFYEMDFQVGGKERSRSRFKEGTPVSGLTCTNETVYQDIVPDRRIVFASTMALAEKRISASLVTVEFRAAGKGTDLICTHQGVFFEGSDGPERRHEGWRKLFERLTDEFPG